MNLGGACNQLQRSEKVTEKHHIDVTGIDLSVVNTVADMVATLTTQAPAMKSFRSSVALSLSAGDKLSRPSCSSTVKNFRGTVPISMQRTSAVDIQVKSGPRLYYRHTVNLEAE